jgi:hypothetical protein
MPFAVINQEKYEEALKEFESKAFELLSGKTNKELEAYLAIPQKIDILIGNKIDSRLAKILHETATKIYQSRLKH